MTDVASVEPRSPAAACTNCGAALHGPFCAACGQESRPLDPPVRYFAREFAQELFDVDSRIFQSLRRLVFSPGFLTREHFAGRRAPWVSPLKLYLLTSVAAFAVMAFAGDQGGLNIAFTPGPGESVEDPLIKELNAAIAAVQADLIPKVSFILVPVFGWLVARVRRDDPRRYPAHLVFAFHVQAAAFAVRAVLTAVTLPFPDSVAPLRGLVVSLYSIGYLYLALRAVYGGTRLRAVRDLLVIGIAYWAATMIVAGGVIWSAALAKVWLASRGAKSAEVAGEPGLGV